MKKKVFELTYFRGGWLQFVLLLSILGRPASGCHVGCLTCSDSSECLLCDTLNFFYFDESGSTCVQKTIPNCFYSEKSTKCDFCESDYFWNATAANCELLEPSLQVKNCRSHDEDKKCILCMPEYTLVDGECVFDFRQIAECSDFDWEGSRCRRCLPGFRLSADQTTCRSLSRQNCLVADSFSCTSCSANYFPRELSFYSTLGLDSLDSASAILFSSFSSDLNRKVFRKFNDILFSRNEFTCEKSQLSNCRLLESVSRCADCVEMFVLSSSGQCESQILPRVPHCLEYAGHGACSKCQAGYFKQSNMLCLPVTETDFCLEYAQAYEGCLECQSGYKLSAQAAKNQCQERTNFPIEGCGKVTSLVNFRKISFDRGKMLSVLSRSAFKSRWSCLSQENSLLLKIRSDVL